MQPDTVGQPKNYSMIRPSRRSSSPDRRSDMECGLDELDTKREDQEDESSINTETRMQESHGPSQVSKEKLKTYAMTNRRRLSNSCGTSMMFVTAVLICTVMFALLPWNTRNAHRWTRGWFLLLAAVSIPIVCVAAVVAGMWNPKPHQRLIAMSFLGSILANQLPRFLSAALGAVATVLFGLSTRPKPMDKMTTQRKATKKTRTMTKIQLEAAVGAVLTTLALLVENFFIWVVSATYYPSHLRSPLPLQDNGHELQTYLFQYILHLSRVDVQSLRATVNVPWALVAALAAAFVSCELPWTSINTPNRNLWALSKHALFTLASVRFIRTVSFLLTVLPSQTPNCYRKHFPYPPPADWWSWLQVGLLPRNRGGCNDLIVSGHATVTTVFACVATSVSGHLPFSIALWSLLAMDFCVEVYEGYHYSVDMWMGAVLTCLLWRVMAPLELSSELTAPKREFYLLSSATAVDITLYALPAIVAYMVIVLLPEATVNYWILLYIAIASVQIVQQGFTHYVQHVLFCMLYIALGAYL